MDALSILILAPIAFFVLLFLHGTAQWRDEAQGRDWRYAFLISAVVWGALVAVSSELLSLIYGLTRAGIGLFWASALLALFVGSDRFRRVPAGLEYLRAELRGLESWEWAVLGGLVAVGGLLLAVAWVSPPNNVDSLLYHMARVVHWAQNRSVEHYPAVFHHQLRMPPWSEEAMLQLRILWGDDRPVALVQWFSMVGSLAIVGFIAKGLGAGEVGQAAASVFVVSLPMGILQSTSTQNDYVVAFWLVAALAFAILGFRGKPTWKSDLGVGLALGLGLLTKVTFYLYAVPVLAGYVVLRAYRSELKRVLVAGALLLTVIAALNLGYWARNFETYGSPLGGIRSNRSRLPDIGAEGGSIFPIARTPVERSSDSPAGGGPRELSRRPAEPAESTTCCRWEVTPVLSSGPGGNLWNWILGLVRQSLNEAALHLITPSSSVNAIIESVLKKAPWLFGGEYFAERAVAAWNHEDTAGNPLHLGLAVVSVPLLVVRMWSSERRAVVFGYAAVVFLGFFILTSFFRVPRIYGLRYHLGFFVAVAPIVGVAADAIIGRPLRILVPLAVILALPWLLLNNMRPVIGMPPWPTRTESVFSTPAEVSLLAIAPHAVDDYSAAAQRIEESGCRRVGLGVGSQDMEYAFWWLLDAPQSGVRIEVINPSAETARYMDADFEPCAVLCTRCQDVEGPLSQMGLAGEYDNYDLYLSDGEQ